MNSISSLCLVLLVSLGLNQIPAATADLISETCAQTLHKDLCEKTLRADPENETADIQGLAGIALNATSAYGKSVQSQIAKLQESTTDKSILQALSDCAENYDDASQQLADSLTALDDKRYADVNTWVSAAMTDSDSCEEEFQTGTSVLTAFNQNFFQLGSNVLAITKKAEGKTA